MDRQERKISRLLTLAAVVMAATLVHREFFNGSGRLVRREPEERATYVEDWKDYRSAGTWLGDSMAPIQIIEFSDLQWPACRGFNETVRTVQQKFPGKVSRLFVHYPL